MTPVFRGEDFRTNASQLAVSLGQTLNSDPKADLSSLLNTIHESLAAFSIKMVRFCLGIEISFN